MQAPSVHHALQWLIQEILFVTYGVGICSTHSLHVVCIRSLKDIQYMKYYVLYILVCKNECLYVIYHMLWCAK